MKAMLLITALVLNFSAFASIEEKLFDAQVNENKSYFESLNELYEMGTLPNPSKLVALGHSGRCFKKTEPDQPINGAIVFRTKSLPDVGPIGNGRVVYEVTTVWSPTKPVDYYDSMSYNDILKNSNGYSFDVLAVEGNSLTAKTDKMYNLYRLSGSYIIEKLFGKNSEDKFENYATCYYFKSNSKE